MIFGVTALAAILAAVARAAGEGGPFARAVLLAFGFLAFCFLAFAMLFLIAWMVALLTVPAEDDSTAGSPFADGQLPPQMLPPREPKP